MRKSDSTTFRSSASSKSAMPAATKDLYCKHSISTTIFSRLSFRGIELSDSCDFPFGRSKWMIVACHILTWSRRRPHETDHSGVIGSTLTYRTSLTS
jgi:hypothetical protein